jgi:hypothetical protein
LEKSEVKKTPATPRLKYDDDDYDDDMEPE